MMAFTQLRGDLTSPRACIRDPVWTPALSPGSPVGQCLPSAPGPQPALTLARSRTPVLASLSPPQTSALGPSRARPTPTTLWACSASTEPAGGFLRLPWQGGTL